MGTASWYPREHMSQSVNAPESGLVCMTMWLKERRFLAAQATTGRSYCLATELYPQKVGMHTAYTEFCDSLPRTGVLRPFAMAVCHTVAGAMLRGKTAAASHDRRKDPAKK